MNPVDPCADHCEILGKVRVGWEQAASCHHSIVPLLLDLMFPEKCVIGAHDTDETLRVTVRYHLGPGEKQVVSPKQAQSPVAGILIER